jgi:hypothetical protein
MQHYDEIVSERKLHRYSGWVNLNFTSFMPVSMKVSRFINSTEQTSRHAHSLVSLCHLGLCGKNYSGAGYRVILIKENITLLLLPVYFMGTLLSQFWSVTISTMKSMNHSPFSEANNYSVSQKISCLSWNL